MHPKVEAVTNKAKDYIKLARVELLIIAIGLVLDLVIKAIIENTFNLGQTRTVIPRFFYLTYIHNPNAAFGSLFGLDRIFGDDSILGAGFVGFLIAIVLAGAIMFGVLYLLNRNKNRNRDFFVKIGIAIASCVAATAIFYFVMRAIRGETMAFLITLTLVATCAFCYVMYRVKGQKRAGAWVRVGLALIISGAIGNLVCRMFRGHVVDMFLIEYFGLNLGWFGTSFPVFNIADVLLVVGVVVFAIGYIRTGTKKDTVAKGGEVSEAVRRANEGAFEDYRDRDEESGDIGIDSSGGDDKALVQGADLLSEQGQSCDNSAPDSALGIVESKDSDTIKDTPG